MPENSKKSRQKNSWNQINQFHDILFAKFHFLQFQKWPKINFWTEKNFKTAKNAISRKKISMYIWFHEFFCLEFLNFQQHLPALPPSSRANFLASSSAASIALALASVSATCFPAVSPSSAKTFFIAATRSLEMPILKAFKASSVPARLPSSWPRNSPTSNPTSHPVFRPTL